jgi:hypothetical protein
MACGAAIASLILETTSADAGDRQTLTTILGETLRAWDANNRRARQHRRSRTYGVLGQVLETTRADAGDRQALTTILGEPLRAWDAKEQCARVTYDDLRRPVDAYVQPAVGSEILLSRTIYGEALASPHATNHRGRAYRSSSGGGQAPTPAFDVRGLPTASELQLGLDPTAKTGWTVIASQSPLAPMATAGAAALERTG